MAGTFAICALHVECLAKFGALDSDFDALESTKIEAGPVLESWLNRAAAQLEQIIPQVAAVIDTQVVVLGGRLPPHLLDYMVARIDIYSGASADYPIPRPKIIASTLGSRAGVIGAAFLPIQAHLLPMK
jgi:predicted NBD/HSP70 family sugar kinase